MIISFESVYKELENLFINKLPEYIEKINKEHNDGIILKPFVNTRLDEECIKLPCFKFYLEESEYTEKDRIIENTIFTVSFEIKLQSVDENKTILFWRYIEAVQKMLKVEDTNNLYKIQRNKENKVYIRITDVNK